MPANSEKIHNSIIASENKGNAIGAAIEIGNYMRNSVANAMVLTIYLPDPTPGDLADPGEHPSLAIVLTLAFVIAW